MSDIRDDDLPFKGRRQRIDDVARQANVAADLLTALRTARVALAKAGHHTGLSGPLIEVDAAIAKAEGRDV